MELKMEERLRATPIVKALRAGRETVWVNDGWARCRETWKRLPIAMSDIDDAEARLLRFAPFLQACFPETAAWGGRIESPLTPIPHMARRLSADYGVEVPGRLYLKRDSDLAVAGSIKARGGIYEILKHSETLALEQGLLAPDGDYRAFASPEFRAFFSRHAVHVGSTGNLGLSIGIISACLGYDVTVHMSKDAKAWKKALLREKGVRVLEYDSDYSAAVREGRRLAAEDPMSYFVDDENSLDLFLGYAVAAWRLAAQLREQDIQVDGAHPLLVYLPCGVGGAPGGITFGLKQVFGDDVYCFFAEPVQAPCMLLGMATGLHNEVSVQDIGLTGRTQADGLAVGRPSKFVGGAVEGLLSGIFTVEDARLFHDMRALLETEGIFVEPSACAGFAGPAKLTAAPELEAFLRFNGLRERLPDVCQVVWATGGSLVPQRERELYLAWRG